MYDAQHWSCLIRDAESPAMFSTRDGRLLKPVPRPDRLSKEALQRHLRDLPDELTTQLLIAWTHGKHKAARSGISCFTADTIVALLHHGTCS